MPHDFEPAARGLRDHLALWQRRIVLIVLLTGICGLAAMATSLLQTARYQSSAQVLVPVEPAGQPEQGNALTRFDPNRVVQTEAVFAVGDQVQRLAETKVGTDGSVTARGAKDSDVITITATASSADRAAAVANAYATSYVELRQGPNGITGVLVVEPAVAPAAPSSPTTTRNVALGLVFGLVIGLAAAYAADHLDDVVRDEDDLVRLIELPVLGSIARDRTGGAASARVRAVDTTDAVIADTDATTLLDGGPSAKVLLVPHGSHGRHIRQAVHVLRNVGIPVAGAVLVVDEPAVASIDTGS